MQDRTGHGDPDDRGTPDTNQPPTFACQLADFAIPVVAGLGVGVPVAFALHTVWSFWPAGIAGAAAYLAVYFGVSRIVQRWSR